MLRLLPLLAAFALAAAAPAGAVPMGVPIDAVLHGTDGNFTFSVVHTSTGGSDGQSGAILGRVDLGASGGTWIESGGIGVLDVELTVDVGGSLSTYDASGKFSLPALLDFTTQADVMLGALSFDLTSGADDAAIDGLTFHFEDRNYSSATNPPNGLSGNVLTLWGATVFTGSGIIGESLDLSPGGRGIDLRVQLGSPIPEPSARPLYLAGLAVVALGAMRMRRR